MPAKLWLGQHVSEQVLSSLIRRTRCARVVLWAKPQTSSASKPQSSVLPLLTSFESIWSSTKNAVTGRHGHVVTARGKQATKLWQDQLGINTIGQQSEHQRRGHGAPPATSSLSPSALRQQDTSTWAASMTACPPSKSRPPEGPPGHRGPDPKSCTSASQGGRASQDTAGHHLYGETTFPRGQPSSPKSPYKMEKDLRSTRQQKLHLLRTTPKLRELSENHPNFGPGSVPSLGKPPSPPEMTESHRKKLEKLFLQAPPGSRTPFWWENRNAKGDPFEVRRSPLETILSSLVVSTRVTSVMLLDLQCSP